MRRLFIKGRLEKNLLLIGGDAHHLGRVMRARTGDKIMVADDEGQSGEYTITGFGENQVELTLNAILQENMESKLELTLAQCLLKGEKMDFIIQKATELGVNNIQPLMSKNCVAKYDAKKAMAKREKWQRVALEAGKQCGRTRLPVVEEIRDFKQWLNDFDKARQLVCMCYENELQKGIKEFLQNFQDVKKAVIIIGPEGGFSPEEVLLAEEKGIAAVSLGKRILRAETAALGAISIVQYEHGDLGG